MQRLILAMAASLWMPAAARAEPISLGIAAISSLLATPVIGTLTLGSALQLAFAAGSIAYSFLAPGPKKPRIDPGEAKNTFETAEGPELRCLGRVRIGGQKFFGNTTGVHRFRMIGHCKGPIDGVEAHYLGGREVVVEPNGAVSSPPFAANGESSRNAVPGSSNRSMRSRTNSLPRAVCLAINSAPPPCWAMASRCRRSSARAR